VCSFKLIKERYSLWSLIIDGLAISGDKSRTETWFKPLWRWYAYYI